MSKAEKIRTRVSETRRAPLKQNIQFADQRSRALRSHYAAKYRRGTR